MEVTRKGYYTIICPDGLPLTKPDGSIRQVTTRDECYEYITDDAKEYDDEEGTYTISCPDRDVLRTDLSTHQIIPADDVAPRIISTPSVSFTVGTPDTYDMSQHVQDDGRSAITYPLIGTLDASLTYSEQTGLLEYDGSAGTTYALTLNPTDAVGSDTSSSFNITISGTYYVATAGSNTNDGSISSPWQTVARVNQATLGPGITVLFNGGETFTGVLENTDSGTSGSAITYGSYGTGQAILRECQIDGDYVVLDNIDFDHNGGANRVVRIRGNNVTVQNCSVHNGTGDGIDVRGGATPTTIDNCEIYHLLAGSFGTDDDAHGIGVRAGAGNNVVVNVTDCTIHEVSGDCIQADPDRDQTGSTYQNYTVTINVTGGEWYTQPLAANTLGWLAGERPGEDGIDTKADVNDSGIINVNVTDLIAHGWLTSSSPHGNPTPFNLKENVTAVLDRITLYDNARHFRLRTDSEGNPDVTIKNAVCYDAAIGFLVDGGVTNLTVYNGTFGSGITDMISESAGGIGSGSDFQNNAWFGGVPAEIPTPGTTNVPVVSGDFVNEATNDWRHLDTSTTLEEQGATIAGVTVDRLGVTRTAPYSIGAYEVGVSSTPYAFYDLLVADSHFELDKAFTLTGAPGNDPQQQCEDTYLVNTSGSYDPTQWNYDATEDAADWLWGTESSKPVGDQLRWGNTPGYNEVVPVSFDVISNVGTMLFVWDWKFSDGWNIEDRDLSIPGVLNNHKAHQIATANASDTRFIEPRHRFTGASNQFPGPSGAQVCSLDFRTYAGPTSGAGGSVPNQLATVYPKAGQWFRWMVFCDYNNLEMSAWAHLDDGNVVQMHDRAGGFSAASMQHIDHFWFECNSSQDGGSGVTPPSHMYARNWVVLNGLTYAEAAALVAQSSW